MELIKMVYYEEGNFKRYEKEITDTSKKSKTGKRKVQQLNITGLSKNSSFEDGQRVIIIGQEDFKNHLEDYQNQEAKIKELSQQVEDYKLTITELEGKLDKTPETVSNTNKILELVDKLDQKQTIIDNHKNIIIQANNKVSNLIEEVTTELTSYFTEEVSDINLSTQTKVIKLLKEVKDINQSNLILMQNVQDQVTEYNNSYDKSNRIKKYFMKKIDIDFTEMETNKELLTEFNSIDIEDTAKNITKKFTIDGNKINEIKNNSKVKSIDFNKIFLVDGDSSEDDKEININDHETQEG